MSVASETSTQNSPIKQVTSFFNPEKLCDFIKSVINRNIQITSENCLDYLEMTVFYQDQNSELEKVIVNYIKYNMNTKLALAVWQVPEAEKLRDDSILFLKNNPQGLKYDFMSTIPVENLMVLLCELGKTKDRTKIINNHEFDCLIKFCMNAQIEKMIPGFKKLFDVYEKRQAEKIQGALKTTTSLNTTDKSSSKRKRTESNTNTEKNNKEKHFFTSCDFTHLFFKNIGKKDYGTGAPKTNHLRFISERVDRKVIGIHRDGTNFPAKNRMNNTYFNLYSPDFPKNKSSYIWRFNIKGQTTHKRSFIFGMCKTEGINALQPNGKYKACSMPHKLTPGFFNRTKNRTQLDFYGFCLNGINNSGIDSLETIEMSPIPNDKQFEEIKYLYKGRGFSEKPEFDNSILNAGAQSGIFCMTFEMKWVPETGMLTLKQCRKRRNPNGQIVPGTVNLAALCERDSDEISLKVNAQDYDKFAIGLQGTPEIQINLHSPLGPSGAKPGTQLNILTKSWCDEMEGVECTC